MDADTDVVCTRKYCDCYECSGYDKTGRGEERTQKCSATGAWTHVVADLDVFCTHKYVVNVTASQAMTRRGGRRQGSVAQLGGGGFYSFCQSGCHKTNV